MMNLGDNYVTGDNIYLRELQNFFFEVLGMMSITHYGAIGDGRTDNYGPLQVAIDDANRRGLSYLYVPYGRFIYTGELINIGSIKFVGNPHSHIVNIRTSEEITIHQFGAPGYFVESYSDLNGKPTMNGHTVEGDMVSGDLELQGELTTGHGIAINNNVISTDGMQDLLIAGSNISISSNNVISAFAGAENANSPILMATLDTDTATTDTSETFPFNTSTAAATGSEYFTLSSNTIVTGTGLTKAEISLHLSVLNTAALKKVELYKNSTKVLTLQKNSANVTFDVSGFLLSVEEGDTISVLYTGAVGDILEAGSFITLQAVEIVAEVIEPFFSAISPTSWTAGEHSASATNSYGTWAISAGPVYNAMPYDLDKVSDGNNNTNARIYTANDDPGWIEFDLPEGVSISPRAIRLKVAFYSATFKGFDGANWDTITTFSSSGGLINEQKSVTSNKYYTKFKLDGLSGLGSGGRDAYNVQIVEGIVKH